MRAAPWAAEHVTNRGVACSMQHGSMRMLSAARFAARNGDMLCLPGEGVDVCRGAASAPLCTRFARYPGRVGAPPPASSQGSISPPPPAEASAAEVLDSCREYDRCALRSPRACCGGCGGGCPGQLPSCVSALQIGPSWVCWMLCRAGPRVEQQVAHNRPSRRPAAAPALETPGGAPLKRWGRPGGWGSVWEVHAVGWCWGINLAAAAWLHRQRQLGCGSLQAPAATEPRRQRWWCPRRRQAAAVCSGCPPPGSGVAALSPPSP